MITAVCILVIMLSAGSAICSWKAMKDAEIDLKKTKTITGTYDLNPEIKEQIIKRKESSIEWDIFRLYDDGELMSEEDIKEDSERIDGGHQGEWVEFKIPTEAKYKLAEMYPIEYDVPF
jgi:CRISPR/Cas system CMR-associated protein Cmr3 (group 5 of RAMP superfamily)